MPDAASTCPACASPLAHDQRYCLGCGVRVGPHRVGREAPRGGAEPLPAATTIVRGRARGGLPRPRTAAALILTTLGAGTLAGAAAGPGAGAATTRAPIVALAPPSGPTAAPVATPAASSGAELPDDTGARAPAPAAPDPPASADPSPAASAPTPAAAAPATEAAPAPTPAPEKTPAPETAAPEGPPAKHVVVVALTGHDGTAFAADSPATYLAHDLPAQGVLLRGYRATTTGSLANELSLLAGAAPTAATRQDCPDPADPGCRLKADAKSLPAGLADGARSWKAYLQGLPAPCSADPAPGYAPARNPFAYMGLQDCATSEASTDALEADFSETDLAPSFAYVVPDTCHDGREPADCPGLEPTGLQRADAWLREWVPKITGSQAFADDGLLVVLFDGGNLPPANPPSDAPPAVGAVVVSSFAKRGAVSERPYDHLSLLRTIAGSFGVEPPGAAAKGSVKSLGRDVLRSQQLHKSNTNP